MDFLPTEIENYTIKHSSPEPELLYNLNRETHLTSLQPRMLSGHLQGRVLSMLSHMIKPSRILEIGTYTGYSALCMAEGLAKDGVLHTIEFNEEVLVVAERYFSKSSYAKQIKQHIGDATIIIPELNEEFDLVFIDADKENYLNYYNLVFDKLKTGAYIIADNVLWSGKVLDEKEIRNDRDTKSIVEFCQFVQNDSRTENVLFPIRDGLLIVRKL